MPNPTIITFATYLVLLLGIGLFFYRRASNIEDYLLGGRRMGPWVTALSAQASDMSGWLLMGLPGAVYISGLSSSWIALGLFIGTALNWYFVSPRLRIYTAKTRAITLPCFFESRFNDPTGLLRTVSAIIILIFFTIYASAGLVSAGKLFESIFDINYRTAVVIGGLVIIVYTFLGGFLAVCWTDFIQALLMFFAIVIVPIWGYRFAGGMDAVKQAFTAKNISTGFIPQTDGIAVVAIISSMSWGLGYFGQPHILARFMSISSVSKLKRSMSIAIIWVFFSLAGAIIAGLVGAGMFDNLDQSVNEHEKVFIYMIDRLFNPWTGGVLLAAILSAIMSTIDSQLLVSSSALTEDFYRKVINKNASEKEVIVVGRACVVIISIIALVLALDESSSILSIIAYAWGGFGAAFGPLVLFALFSKRTTWLSALFGMVVGTAVLVVWKQTEFSKYMYEIVPGFAANCLTILITNHIVTQKDRTIVDQFEQVVNSIKSNKENDNA